MGHYNYDNSSLKKVILKSPKIEYIKSGPEVDEINYQQKLKIVRQVLNNKNRLMVDHEKNVGPGSYNIHPV